MLPVIAYLIAHDVRRSCIEELLENLPLTGGFGPELDSTGHTQRNTDDDRVDGRVLVPAQTCAPRILINDSLDQFAITKIREFFRSAHDRREFYRYRIAFPQDPGAIVVAEPEVPDSARDTRYPIWAISRPRPVRISLTHNDFSRVCLFSSNQLIRSSPSRRVSRLAIAA